MKANWILLFIIIIVSCSTSYDNDIIIGSWMGEGYNCFDKQNITEEVQVSKVDDGYVAIKVTGDNCIPAGDTSFVAIETPDSLEIIMKGRHPSTMEYVYNYASLRITSEDSFVIEIDGNPVLSFIRKN